jgi:hypothetical protein
LTNDIGLCEISLYHLEIEQGVWRVSDGQISSRQMDFGVQKGFWTDGPWCPEGVLDRWILGSRSNDIGLCEISFDHLETELGVWRVSDGQISSRQMDFGVQKGFWTYGPWCPEGVLDKWTLVSRRCFGQMDLGVQ